MLKKYLYHILSQIKTRNNARGPVAAPAPKASFLSQLSPVFSSLPRGNEALLKKLLNIFHKVIWRWQVESRVWNGQEWKARRLHRRIVRIKQDLLASTRDVRFRAVFIITGGDAQFTAIAVFTSGHKINICIRIIITRRRWRKWKASFSCWRASYAWVAATASYLFIQKPRSFRRKKINCQVNAAIWWITRNLSCRRAPLVLNARGEYLFR